MQGRGLKPHQGLGGDPGRGSPLMQGDRSLFPNRAIPASRNLRSSAILIVHASVAHCPAMRGQNVGQSRAMGFTGRCEVHCPAMRISGWNQGAVQIRSFARGLRICAEESDLLPEKTYICRILDTSNVLQQTEQLK